MLDVRSVLERRRVELFNEYCNVPYVSPNVAIKSSQLGGRGLFAENYISAGELIISEDAEVLVLDETLLSSKWYNADGGDSWLLLFEILKSGSEHILNELAPYDVCSKDIDELDELPGELRSLLKTRYLTDLERLQALYRVMCNSFSFSTFSEVYTGRIFEPAQCLSGTGLYNTSSRFNHSCVPNVFRFSIGSVNVFRASRDIGKGEELFISYIPTEVLLESKKVRTRFLRYRSFQCTCLRCLEEKELVEETNVEILPSTIFLQFARLSSEEKVINLTEFLNSISANSRLQFGDELHLRICMALALRESNSDEELKCWCACKDLAKRFLPVYDFTHVWLEIVSGNILSQETRKMLMEFYRFSDCKVNILSEIFREILKILANK